MTPNGWLQIAVFFLLILACAKPLGTFIAAVMEGKQTFLTPVLTPFEKLIYRLCGVTLTAEGQPEEQHWTAYAAALLAFSAISALLLYAMQRLQGWLPFNPLGLNQNNVSPDLAFNTAISFSTNTNWQSYVPETTLSYFVQMAGLTMHNFLSAAAGLAIAVALVRGFARHSVQTIGNFWADLTRATLYILLPLSLVAALVLCSQGVIQNLSPYTTAITLEGAKQTIAQGPVASQEAIKMLGTNGGGFFNANSAHPFENPTPFSNMFQMFLIFLIPGALTYTFGPMDKYLKAGKVDMGSAKVPTYIQASGVPETGFQTDWPVGDAHWSRAVGLADVRTAKDFAASATVPEMSTLSPWFRDKVAAKVGLKAVPAQAVLWGAGSGATGVDSPIGAGKLELTAMKIGQTASRLGITPETLLQRIIRGKGHAAVAGGLVGGGLLATDEQQ